MIEAGPVNYATAADGVTVAYQRFGRGPPILRVPMLPLALRVQPLLGDVSGTHSLSPSASVVTWDPRGTGMSDRAVAEPSFEAWLADAVAVAEAVDAPLPVYATAMEGPIALLLASRRPDLVSHLILGTTGADGEELAQTPVQRSVMALLEVDWDFCLNFILRAVMRVDHAAADDLAEILRDEIDPDVMRETYESFRGADVRHLISDLAVPTLVFEERRLRPQRDLAAGGRALSRLIPGAQMAQIADRAELRHHILAFLPQQQLVETHGAFRTIMFTDLVSSTALTQRVGDNAAQEIVEAHDEAVRVALTAHHGVEVKHTGDGIMAAFDSATDAARAAQQIAVTLRENGVDVRIGLNAGEPIERDGDLFGTAVQLAARVGDSARGGQVLAAQVVRDLTAGKGLTWSPAAPIEAKGFDEPIVVYALEVVE